MPANNATTFASAAARSNQDDTPHARGGKDDSTGTGTGDWSRPRPNGVGTATFRRPSTQISTSSQSSSQQSSSNHHASSSTTNTYVHPHQHQLGNGLSNGVLSHENRYAKEQLLSVFRTLREKGDLSKNLSRIYVGGWEPKSSTGNGPSAGWNIRDDQRKGETVNPGNGPEICWEASGGIGPLGLSRMTVEESELFTSSVNSPLKPPPQNPNKDQTTPNNAALARKVSGPSHQASGTVSSPAFARPGNRRRETSDVTSPPFKDDVQTPPPILLRRKTDARDGDATEPDIYDREPAAAAREPSSNDATSNFPNFLRRSAPGPMSASANGPVSPWAREGGSFSPMGSFGAFGAVDAATSPATPTEKKIGAGSLRGGSRWSKFMKDGTDETGASRLAEMSSLSNLPRVGETENARPTSNWRDARASRPMSNDTDPFGGEGPSGSAALGGGQDTSPRPSRLDGAPGMETPIGNHSSPGFHLSDVGMASNLHERHQGVADLASQAAGFGGKEPLSPTETNPYQSPQTEKASESDLETTDAERHGGYHGGLSGLAGPPPNRAVRGLSNPFEGLDNRGYTSGIGAGGRAFDALGWHGGAGAMMTPDLELAAGLEPSFGGNSVFGPMGDLHSPSLANTGGASALNSGSAGSGTAGRGSKLGSLFPAAMQAQMQHGAKQQQQQQQVSNAFGTRGLDPQGVFAGISGPSARPFDATGMNYGVDVDNTGSIARAAFDHPAGSHSEGTRISNGSENARSAFAAAQGSSSMQLPSSAASTNPNESQSAGSSSAPSMIPMGAQQRQMIMPDRMRWVYRDPQGAKQGPWSGLEMHDWFKAGFFTAELLVKRVEDAEYEPLGQLIRKIGNSREPFLVPQMGLLQGPPLGQSASQWAVTGAAAGPATPAAHGGVVQPPFAGAFPSFGTTLTAEQQNALERRKQEEQFLMARQKEFLAQQHALNRQGNPSGGPPHGQPLQHHASARSLQSQPSFGSIASPGTFHPTPPQGPVVQGGSAGGGGGGLPGPFDAQMKFIGGGVGGPIGAEFANPLSMPEHELVAMLAQHNLGRERQHSISGVGAPPTHPQAHSHQHQHQHPHQHQHQHQHEGPSTTIASMLAQRAQQEREQAMFEAMQHEHPHNNLQRLEQFHQLRAQHDSSYPHPAGSEGVIGKPPGQQRAGPHQGPRDMSETTQSSSLQQTERRQPMRKGDEHMSLTQQVQAAASAKASPLATATNASSAWSTVATSQTGLPQPFPPPPPAPSTTPLPAPSAQRSRPPLPEALEVESSSPPIPSRFSPPLSNPASASTPSTIAAASIAPWAQATLPNAAPQAPSLKEIQEIEARKAAKAEEVASHARRMQLEQERASHAAAASPTAPGLPMTSTWASGTPPATPQSGSSGSVWAKPSGGMGNGTKNAGGNGKKALSQILKEEEDGKRRVAAAAAAAAAATNGSSANGMAASAVAGKRYADLAGKGVTGGTGSGMTPSGPWMTVGSSGKAKGAPVAPTGMRSGSATTVSTSSGKLIRPVGSTTRSATVGGSTTATATATATNSSGTDDFTKWAKAALRGLDSHINVDDFLQQLLSFPPSFEILSESIYASSKTMDGRRFAEEFLRRRKLVDGGGNSFSAMMDTTAQSAGGNTSGTASSGWNEVAKKGAVRADKPEGEREAFKIVAGKKKGRK